MALQDGSVPNSVEIVVGIGPGESDLVIIHLPVRNDRKFRYLTHNELL